MTRAILKSEFGIPVGLKEQSQGRNIGIFVVYTSINATLAALKDAGRMAQALGMEITLVVPEVVPYPLPLEKPPVVSEFMERRFRVIADRSGVEANVRIFLCRDKSDGLARAMASKSIVILGGPKRRWWPTSEQALAKSLQRAGHEVIFKEME